MAAIFNSAILDSAILNKTLTQTNSIWLKLIHSHSTWWWWPSLILPSWILPFCWKLWLKLIQSDSNSFLLTLLDDGSHLEFCQLEFCHLGFSHLSISSQTHSHLPRLVPTFCPKKTSLIHSDSTWWWQPSWILPSWIQPFWTKLWLKLIQSDLNSFLLT